MDSCRRLPLVTAWSTPLITMDKTRARRDMLSQSDPHPEVGPSVCQSRHSIDSDSGEAHDTMTGVIEQTSRCPHMVTGATGVQGEIRYRPYTVTGGSKDMRNGLDMVTAVQEEIPYCSSGISSGKQKKARSTSQPHFHSENTPATNEADQILLTLQQLATNSNSANVNNNSNRF